MTYFKNDNQIVAKKSLGQHFLKNPRITEKIVQAGRITENDTIFEIGPGLGALTDFLVSSPASKIYLCEKDKALYELIRDKYASGRIKVICEDALTLIPSLQVSAPFKVISNLPYNISSPVIISLLTVCPTLPEQMVLMLQKEVAQRLTAKAGDSNRGWLTVLLELMATSRIVCNVSKNEFYPVPEVESAVLSVENIGPLPEGLSAKQVIRILKAGFGGKRKKIKNSIFAYFKIDPQTTVEISHQANISLDDRAEDLKKEQWLALLAIFTQKDLLK